MKPSAFRELYEGKPHGLLLTEAYCTFCVKHGAVATPELVNRVVKECPRLIRTMKRKKMTHKQMHDNLVRYMGEMTKKDRDLWP